MESIITRYLEELHVAMDNNDKEAKSNIEKKLSRILDNKSKEKK